MTEQKDSTLNKPALWVGEKGNMRREDEMIMAETEIANCIPVANAPKKSIPRRILPWALRIFGGIVFVCLLVAMYLGVAKINSMSRKITSLQKKISNLEYKISYLEVKAIRQAAADKYPISRSSVDLTVPDIQNIARDFKVVDLSVQPQLTGVKISGFMINPSSLLYSNLKFTIIINNNRREFMIPGISPGHKTRFEVYVPNTPVDKSESGEIEFVEAMVATQS